jgi:ribosomal protein S18 acetylase RimI-like enzyme
VSEPSTATVRAAEVEDADAIGRIHVDSWRHAYAGLMDDDLLADLDASRRAQVWRERLLAGAAAMAVAERGGVVVGFVGFGPGLATPESTGQVYAVYVDPVVQGTGVGAALMNHAVAALAAQRFADAVLWVLEDNPVARAFYERGGWRPDGAFQVETFGGTALREVRYRRSLG